ncbi:MAG: nitrate/nitrite transporter NrtS [Methylobacter sp.]|nr:nitrate/nitrite transporter NrtS [Methylobacter sp.]
MAIQPGIYRRSFRMAFVVGTVLNLINQPQTLLRFFFFDFPAMERLNIIKTLLTYAVPFLVATYGALTALDLRLIDSQNKPST